MAPSTRSYHLLKFVLPAFCLLMIIAYFLSANPQIATPNAGWHINAGQTQESGNQGGIAPVPAKPNQEISWTKSTFIEAAADWEIDGSFDQRPLHRLCTAAKWNPGLMFECQAAYGGVGNVRNTILTCVRYAIEAGATSLIMPEIKARDADLIGLKGKNLPFKYMFDRKHFIAALNSACPQIQIIAHRDDLADIPSVAKAAELTPKHLGTEFKAFRVMNFAPQWRGLFDKWLPQFAAPEGLSAEKPVLVSITPAIFEFPNNFDTPDFTATYGRILRFHEDIRRLAGIVLYAMDKKYNLDIDPAQKGIPAPRKYYGAHLRTAADATKAGFAPYEAQAAAYLADANKHQLQVVYLASGSAPDIERFTKQAAEQNISVTTKLDLLSSSPEFANALEEMNALSWDQQAEIDFLVLLRSSVFGGTWASSFAWNIVFRRHVVVNNGVWIPSKAALDVRNEIGVTKRDDPRSICYEDKISTIFGDDARGIWFELSMWP